MKTAVKWLVEQVNSDCLNSTFIRPELIEQAKEMEKEQIMNACKQCSYSYEEAEQYYKITFKSE